MPAREQSGSAPANGATASPLHRAHEARYILESAVFGQAVAAVDARLVNQWRGATSARQRERLHVKQEALAEIHAELMEHVKREARTEAERGEDGPFRALLRKVMGRNQ